MNCSGTTWLKRFWPNPNLLGLAVFIGVLAGSGNWVNLAARDYSSGPFVQSFSMTLEKGWRREAMGPFLSCQQTEDQVQWTVNPFLSYVHYPAIDSTEVDFLYPLFTYDRNGEEYRWHIAQLFSFAGGQSQDPHYSKRFTLFPLYFSQRSTNPQENYTAMVPFYGHLNNRLWRDETDFVLYPLYVKTRKKDVITKNYCLPLFHLRQGNALKGWQFWPLVGNETKGVTTRTNSLDEIETIGGHEKFFAFWPLYFDQRTGLGTTNVARSHGLLPLYAWHRSPQRDSSSYAWPLFTYTVDRERNYREWDYIWPFIEFARGEGKTMDRWWPFYGLAYNTNLQSDFLMWPVYKHNRFKTDALQRDRTRIFFYLYSDLVEKLPGTNQPLRRTDLWPLFTARRDHQGNERLQILALLEPLLPQRKSLERNYSPLWSVWRWEKNGKTGDESRSFLWNLYRGEKKGAHKKSSWLFGLFQHQSTADGTQWRIFYVPIGSRPKAVVPPTKS